MVTHNWLDLHFFFFCEGKRKGVLISDEHVLENSFVWNCAHIATVGVVGSRLQAASSAFVVDDVTCEQSPPLSIQVRFLE